MKAILLLCLFCLSLSSSVSQHSGFDDHLYDYYEDTTTVIPYLIIHDNIPTTTEFVDSLTEITQIFEDGEHSELYERVKSKVERLKMAAIDVLPSYSSSQLADISAKAMSLFKEKVENMERTHRTEIDEIVEYGKANDVDIFQNDCYKFDKLKISTLEMQYSNRLRNYLNFEGKKHDLEAKNATSAVQEIWYKISDIHLFFQGCRTTICLKSVEEQADELFSDLVSDFYKKDIDRVSMAGFKRNALDYAIKCFIQTYKDSKHNLNQARTCIDAIRIFNTELAALKKKLMDDMKRKLDSISETL